MNESHIIKSLNLTKGDSLTLEKATDRMEFEALPIMTAAVCRTVCECNGTNDTCNAVCNAYA
jgi:hypothetical protein